MSYYSNPKIPEGINVSDKTPLRSFIKQSLVMSGIFLGLILFIGIVARILAPFIPFSWEESLYPVKLLEISLTDEEKATEQELQALADRLAAKMGLPKGMTIKVHYSTDRNINAYATLGGHVVVYKGLLELMENEEAVAAVMAHEIAHVKHRDVAKNLTRGLGIFMLLAGTDTSSGWFEGLAQTSMLTYSRGQEKKADDEATKTLGEVYGHTQGFESSFLALLKTRTSLESKLEGPEILASHPDLKKRVKRSKKLAETKGYQTSGPLTPLPPALQVKKDTPTAAEKTKTE